MSSKLPITDRIAAEFLHWFPKQAFSRGVGWCRPFVASGRALLAAVADYDSTILRNHSPLDMVQRSVTR